MSRVKINPAILSWAQQRAELDQDQLAKKVGLSKKPETLQAWEEGVQQPTYRQAQTLARALNIPIGYLFLSSPPPTTLPVADFRSLPEIERGKFSPDLQDVLNDALRKSDWYREWLIQEGFAPHSFIGKYNVMENPERIANDIRNTLSLTQPTTRKFRSWDEHFRYLVDHTEEAGILVLQSGIVKNNTQRKLSIEEFRGFALADEYAPLIFINSQDYVSARIFTLAHELGHLWTGTSGISNPKPTHDMPAEAPSIERLCNQIAAELLVPTDVLLAKWDTEKNLYDTAQDLAKEFRVSVFVILVRINELRLSNQNEFRAAWLTAADEVRPKQQDDKKGGGGDFYNNLRIRSSRLLVQELISALTEGQILYQEAAQLLNVKPRTLNSAVQRWR